MARQMTLAGVDPSELAPPPPPERPKTLGEKLSNFWYHHKPFVIAGIFLLVLATWFIVQMVAKDDPDYRVVLVTEQPLLNQSLDGIQTMLTEAGEDVDGDGVVEVEIENLCPAFYDQNAPTIGRADMQNLMTYLATGERMLYVFDAVSYENFCNTVAEATDDGYVFFAPFETTSPQYDSELHYWNWNGDPRIEKYGIVAMSEDVYFGVRSPEGMADRSSSKALYEQCKRLLENLTA